MALTSSLSNSGTTVASVYEQLKAEIVRGTLRPNEPLVEAALAQRLGVSRTPVREALTGLAGQGLIVSRSRRWYVYEHTAQEISEIYEVRAANEGYAARLACVRATSQQLEEIEASCNYGIFETAKQWVEANDRFHDAINAACGNAKLIGVIQNTRLYHFNVRSARSYSPTERENSLDEHAEIATAIANGDEDYAETMVRKHVQGAAEIALRVAP